MRAPGPWGRRAACARQNLGGAAPHARARTLPRATPPSITATTGRAPGGGAGLHLDSFWLLLGLKMAITAATVVAASKFVERAGPFLGAMVATLPVSAGPAYIFLAAEHGAAFVEKGSVASLAANAAIFLYIALYTRLAQRCGLAVSVGAPLVLWTGAAALIVNVDWTFAGALAFNVGAFAISFLATRPFRARAVPPPPRGRWWDVPFRALLVAALVGAVVMLGRAFGPQAAGVAAYAPVVMVSLGLILQPRIGGGGAAAVLSHALVGLVGFGAATAMLHLTVVPLGAVASLSLALAVSVGWNLGLVLWRRRMAREG